MDSTTAKGKLMEATTHRIAMPVPATKGHVSAPAEERTLPQLTLGGVLAVWAAAALPMALLAWFVAPRLAHHLSGPGSLAQALIITLTGGVILQVRVLVMVLRREEGGPRWAGLREARLAP